MKTVKARKQHQCDCCGQFIQIDEHYAFERVPIWAHSDNESFWSYRAHLNCEEVWQQVGAEFDWIPPCDKEFLEIVESKRATLERLSA